MDGREESLAVGSEPGGGQGRDEEDVGDALVELTFRPGAFRSSTAGLCINSFESSEAQLAQEDLEDERFGR